MVKVRQARAERKGIVRTVYEDMYWEWETFGRTLYGLNERDAEAFILIKSIKNLYDDHMSRKQGRK